MKVYPFQAIYPEFDLITSPDSFFKSVKNQYVKYRESGFFKRSSQDAIYIHEIEKNGRLFTGIVASVDVSEFESGKVLKHEHTIAAKQQIMTQLLLERQAMIKPILLAYQKDRAINQFIQNFIKKHEPNLVGNFENNIEIHRFYQVSDGEDVKKMTSLIEKNIGQSYIADGHHRTATIKHLYKTGQLRKNKDVRKTLLCTLFPFDQLEIHDFNRVVDVFDSMSSSAFLVKLSKYCKLKSLSKAQKPKSKHELTMYFNGEWIQIKWKQKVLDFYKKSKVLLDAEVLNEFILTRILHIEDIRTSHRIRYIEGVKGMDAFVATVNADHKRVGFCLFPVTTEEIITVADNKLNLPPKSTWFEPRVKNGIIAEEF